MVKRPWFWLIALLAVSAWMRTTGLDWGLPWSLHIDERLFVVGKALHLEKSLLSGDGPDPGISSYGILPLWLLVGARALFLGAATTDAAPIYGDEFAATVWLGRAIAASWSIATILLVALWARRFDAPDSFRTSALATALAAGSPALIQSAHFGTVEAPLVALLVAGALAAERIAESPTWGRVLAGGAILGLALSTKAPGAVLALPLAHAAWQRDSRQSVMRIALGGAVAGLLVFALNPLLVFGGGDGGQGQHTTLGGNLARIYSTDFHDWTLPYVNDVPVLTEVTRLLPFAIGPLAMVFALGGLGVLLRRRRGPHIRLLLAAAPILLLLLPAQVKTIRFLLPALPFLAVAAAVAATSLTAGRAPAFQRGLAMVLAGATLLQGLAFSRIYTDQDSRLQAAFWLDENVPPREIVVVEDPPGYGPPIGSPSPQLRRPPLNYELLWRNFYTGHEQADEATRREHIERTLRRADWLALSEGHRAEFTASPELRPVESQFYADLDSGRLGFERVIEFKSYPRLGPFVLPDDGAEVLMRIFDHPRIEIWRRADDGAGS